jgi:hypothetical protein
MQVLECAAMVVKWKVRVGPNSGALIWRKSGGQEPWESSNDLYFLAASPSDLHRNAVSLSLLLFPSIFPMRRCVRQVRKQRMLRCVGAQVWYWYGPTEPTSYLSAAVVELQRKSKIGPWLRSKATWEGRLTCCRPQSRRYSYD